MVKLVGAYGKPQDTDAFDAHDAQTHAPLAQKIPNVRQFEYGKVLGTADGASPQGQAAYADVANFASGGVTLMIAEA